MFIKTLKAKIYKKWQLVITNPILVICRSIQWYYHHSFGRKPTNVDYSALIEKIDSNLKTPI